MLRNRFTRETFDQSGKPVKKYFFKPREYPDADKAIKLFLDDVEQKRLPPNIDKSEKNKIMQLLYDNAQKNKAIINELISDPKKLKACFGKKESKLSSSEKIPDSFDLIKDIFKLMMNAYFPVEAFVLAMLPLAAAQVSDYIVHEGIPKGGKDLCSSVLFGCIQGYLTKGTDPWTLDLPQFNRVVYNSTGSLRITASETIVLENCMDAKKVGGLVVNALDNGNSTVKMTVPLSSGQRTWHQLGVSGQASQIPSDQMIPLENEFEIEGQGCMNDWAKFKYDAMIAGIVIAGVCGIALCVGACYCVAKECDEESNDRCCRP